MASRIISAARARPLMLAPVGVTASACHSMRSNGVRNISVSTRTSPSPQQKPSQMRTINMASVSATTTSTMQPPPKMDTTKREGDISDAFFSLSHTGPRPPLPDRFRELKQSLVQGHEQAVIKSWECLLEELKQEVAVINKLGSAIVPSIEFTNLDQEMESLRGEIQKRGVAVIRGVVPEAEARGYKEQIEEYIRQNPSTKAFPQNDPQVYELYWSSPQLRARSHPNLLRASRALMDLWHSSDPSSVVSLTQPLSYADRLRIRQPGDASFALGPHIDGGSVERWERHGYGAGGVYDAIFQGRWAGSGSQPKKAGEYEYDPWDVSPRVNAVMDNYSGLGACSAFRMYQGWLSMSRTAPGEGTLKVNPMLRHAMAYVLLRPFFEPIKKSATGSAGFLDKANWRFMPAGDAKGAMNSDLQGAVPGHGQELTDELHPHLQLDKSMVHVPEIKPGDFVVWHCDTIHAVDKLHAGKSDSSVLYIPVCPTTSRNAEYMLRQREAFLNGTPGPDFPGGKGESEHIGRPTEEFLHRVADEEGLRALGFMRLNEGGQEGEGEGARSALEEANRIFGF